MCGLFASVGRDANIEHLRRVNHRGPDGEGWQLFSRPDGAPVRLGHKRLSIIDPGPQADQPFSSTDERYHIVYNGMIYNYKSLRLQLEHAGHIFHTASDTEVLLAAFTKWGTQVTAHLDGMYAFVIHDTRTGDVFAARDRFGIKPLYYVEHDGAVAIASEIKQIYDIWGRTPAVSQQGALDFLIDGLTDFLPQTMFAGVRRLPAGHKMIIRSGEGVKISKCLTPKPNAHSRIKTPSAQALHTCLEGSVATHLQQDATIGFCLSGGLDSGSLVLKAKDLIQGEALGIDSLRCVTASFPGTDVDETDLAGQVADAANAEHICVTGTPAGLAELLSDIVYYQDEPFPSTSIYVQWTVFKQAQQAGLKVMLDGQGADEMMFGYHHVFPSRLWNLIKRGKWVSARRFWAARVALYGPANAKRDRREVLRKLMRTLLPGFIKNPFNKGQRSSGFPHWVSPGIADGKSSWTNAVRRTNPRASLTLQSWRDTLIQQSCLPMLLRYEDRNSMAHGIEARLPFLDENFADFCLNQPVDLFFNDAWTKWPLRDPNTSPLPTDIREKVIKIGFAAPEDHWLRADLKDWMIDNVHAAMEAFPDLFRRSVLSDMIDRFSASPQSIQASELMTLYRIGIFACWTNRFNLKQLAPDA